MRPVFRLLLLSVFCFGFPALAEPPKTVWLEELTWPEIKDAIKNGKTTVIIPTGGTEQNGPAIALGKHNFLLKYTAMETANRLGNAMVTPILEYVPEGDIHPPTGHMRYPGTLSLRPETFAAVLEDTAASLKEHGFKLICFLGEHGASQAVQAQVAAKLDAAWKADGVHVLQVGDYYDEHNGQVAWAKQNGIDDPDIEAHAGFADTSEMLAIEPAKGAYVRPDLLADHAHADMATVGAGGKELQASRNYGARLIELKVQAAVKQIKAAQAAAR